MTQLTKNKAQRAASRAAKPGDALRNPALVHPAVDNKERGGFADLAESLGMPGESGILRCELSRFPTKCGSTQAPERSVQTKHLQLHSSVGQINHRCNQGLASCPQSAELPDGLHSQASWPNRIA